MKLESKTFIPDMYTEQNKENGEPFQILDNIQVKYFRLICKFDGLVGGFVSHEGIFLPKLEKVETCI